MLKKLLLTFFTLNLFCMGFAQVKTPFELVGKSKGKIKVLLLQNEPFVAGRAFGRALGMQSTAYGASGRLELNDGSKTALLTKQESYAYINKQKKNLTQAPFEQDNILYVPLEFFNQFSSYDIVFFQNKIIAERRYTLSFKEQKDQANKSQVFFRAKGELPFRIEKSTKDKVEIFFPGAIVKRDEIISSKNNFLHRIRVSQKSKGVEIVALLKKDGKYWDFYYDGKSFVFEVSLSQIERSVTSEDQQEEEPITTLRPSVLDDNQEQTEPEEIIELGDEFFSPAVSVSEVTSVQKPASRKDTPSSGALPAPTILPVVASSAQNKGKLKILIDPGHGGKDPGATRKGSAREKELNLKVAKQVYDILSKEKNVEVKMTRSDDTFISLGERARLSGKYASDIFVSIHTNAAKRSTASGFEVYFRSDKASDDDAAQTAALENEALQYEGQTNGGVSFADLLLQSLATNENINQSSKLAAHIRLLASKNANNTGIKVFNNSAIKQANFYVLKGVKCPAVLVEMGYISNLSDRKRLNNKNTQTLIAKIIAKGILTYAKEEGWK
jgi:N-acetylmuramoyl-L-alanine amidase